MRFRCVIFYRKSCGAVRCCDISYGADRHGSEKEEILRRAFVRLKKNKKTTVRFGAVFRDQQSHDTRFGAVFRYRKSYGTLRCCVTSSDAVSRKIFLPTVSFQSPQGKAYNAAFSLRVLS